MEAHVPISVPFFFLFAMHTDDVSSTLRQCSQRMLYYYYRYCLQNDNFSDLFMPSYWYV